MIASPQRQTLIEAAEIAVQNGARQDQACKIVGLSPRSLQRWKLNPDGQDKRSLNHFKPHNAYTTDERDQLLYIANTPEYQHLPPGQFVPIMADKGL